MYSNDYCLNLLVISAIVGLIPATIAYKKGRNFFAWWIFGAAFFIVALPAAILVKSQEETGFGKRKCPYCAERIRPEAQVCKHCGRDLPPAFTIPAKYSFQQLPPSEAEVIHRKSPEQNLGAAKRFIERKKWHQAIASLQVVVDKSPPSSQAYGEAYGILYEMLGGYKSAHNQKPGPDAIPRVTRSTQPDDASGGSITTASICPVCGVQMDIRTANQGERKGKRFYVCPNYSKCKQVIPID
jgi:ssDNA-binding Zn-finger/Zn-ribbon topoisomerase 1